METFINSNTPLSKKKSKTTKYIITTILFIILLHNIKSFTVSSVLSKSYVVGDLSQYNITLSSCPQFNSIVLQFLQDPNDNNRLPFYTNRTIKINNGANLSCSDSLNGRKIIACTWTTAITTVNNTISLTNMHNPFSTQPYPITIYLSGNTSQTNIAWLNMSSVSTTTNFFKIGGYINETGATSQNVNLLVASSQAINSSYIFKLTSPGYITFQSPSTTSTSYTFQVLNNTNILFSNWTTSVKTIFSFSSGMINPNGAMTVILSGQLSYFVGSNQYLVQKYTLSISIQASSYSSITYSPALIMGTTTSSLTISLACGLSSLVSPSQIIMQYKTTDLSIPSSNTYNTTYNQINQSFPSIVGSSLALTNVSTLISEKYTISFTTYTSINGIKYASCSSLKSFTPQSQSLSGTSISGCSSNQTGKNNTIIISIPVQSVQAGHIIRIYVPIDFVVQSSSSWVLDNTNTSSPFYYQTINSSHILSSSINITLKYVNPTYLSSTYSITKIQILKDLYSNGSLVKYAEYLSSLILCPVTVLANLTSLQTSITTSPSLTYEINDWRILITPSFLDYKITDYAQIQFFDAPTAFNYNSNGSVVAFVNSINVSTTRISSTKIKIILQNQVSSSSPSFQIVVKNVLSSAVISPKPYVTVTMYSSFSLTAKQIRTSSPLTLTAYTPTMSISSVQLLANNNITFTLTNLYRSYTSTSLGNSNFSFIVPFKCNSISNSANAINPALSLGSNTTTITGQWINQKNTISISLIQCYVGYFTSNQLSITFEQKYSGSNSSSIIQSSLNAGNKLINKCGDNCYLCNSNTLACISCFNTTYNLYNYFYKSQCHISCPSGSYNSNGFVCQTCTQPCKSCTGALVTQCQSCSANFTLQSSGLCVSVCGTNKFYDTSIGSCNQCSVGCDNCLSSTKCYYCTSGASLLPTGACAFTDCTPPCKTCQNSSTICLSCDQSYFLYKNQCFLECPSGSYLSSSTSQCIEMTGVVLYFPIFILSVVLIALGFLLRFIAGKSKFSVIIYLSVVFGYSQLLSSFLLVGFAADDTVRGLTILAIIIGMIINIIYTTLYLCKKLKNKNVLSNVNQQQNKKNNDQEEGPSNLKNLSDKQHESHLKLNPLNNNKGMSISMNNTVNFNNTMNAKSIKDTSITKVNPNNSSNSNNNNKTLKSTRKSKENIVIQTKQDKKKNKSIEKVANQGLKQNSMNNSKIKNISSLNNNDSNNNKTQNVQKISNINKQNKQGATINNLLQPSNRIQEQYKQMTGTEKFLIVLSYIFTFKTHRFAKMRFLENINPLPEYFLWFSIASIFLYSVILMIAAIVQIVSVDSLYFSKIFIGIDTLLVVSLSIFIRVWDFWRQKWGVQDTSTVSNSQRNQVNQTQQNLKNADQQNQGQIQTINEDDLNDKITQKVGIKKSNRAGGKFFGNSAYNPKKTNSSLSPNKGGSQNKNQVDSKMRKTLPSPSKNQKNLNKQFDKDDSKISATTKNANQVKRNNRYGFSNFVSPKSMNAPNTGNKFGNGIGEEDQIPDVRIFDDLDLQDQIDYELKGEKIKKINRNDKNLVVPHDKSNFYSQNFRSSNYIHRGIKKNKNNRLDDIFIGFDQDARHQNQDLRNFDPYGQKTEYNQSDNTGVQLKGHRQHNANHLRKQDDIYNQLEDFQQHELSQQDYNNNINESKKYQREQTDLQYDSLAFKDKYNLQLHSKIQKQIQDHQKQMQQLEKSGYKSKNNSPSKRKIEKQPNQINLQQRSNRQKSQSGRQNQRKNKKNSQFVIQNLN